MKLSLAEYEKQRASFGLNATQQKIYDGLQAVSLNGRAFAQKLNENLEHVLAAIDALQCSPEDVLTIEQKRLRQRKIIEAIKEDSRVFYRPSALGRSPRLYATNESVLSLQSSVRKAFCRGWVEADLVSSQFIILAGILNAPIALGHIATMQETGWHLWTYLHEASGGQGRPTGRDKAILKELVYGICFGMSVKTITKRLAQAGKSQLRKDPLIRELLRKRAQWFQEIKRAGYILDVWGNRHEMAEDRWEGSLAATFIQAIEMEIISAVFDYQERAGGTYDFKVMAFQHDGFTVSVSDKARYEYMKKGMNRAVKAKAREIGKQLGIKLEAVTLEFTQL